MKFTGINRSHSSNGGYISLLVYPLEFLKGFAYSLFAVTSIILILRLLNNISEQSYVPIIYLLLIGLIFFDRVYRYILKIIEILKDSKRIFRLFEILSLNTMGLVFFYWYIDDIFNILHFNSLYRILSTLGVHRTIGIVIFIAALIIIYIKHSFTIMANEKTRNPEGLFLSDKELENANEDILGITDNAKNFSNVILNNGSKESMVFCINAPWGIGKSSFVNICKKELEDKHVIVYKFDPLRYQDQTTLLDKYVDGLIVAIKEHIYAPELSIFLTKYQNKILPLFLNYDNTKKYANKFKVVCNIVKFRQTKHIYLLPIIYSYRK